MRIALVLLGISLAIKHDLALLPLWLAMRGSWRQRVLVLTIPYAIWLAFFIPPILAGGGPSIWRWVFMFRGFGNAPLWKMLIPPQVLSVVPPFALFLTALLVCGWVVTRQQP